MTIARKIYSPPLSVPGLPKGRNRTQDQVSTYSFHASRVWVSKTMSPDEPDEILESRTELIR